MPDLRTLLEAETQPAQTAKQTGESSTPEPKPKSNLDKLADIFREDETPQAEAEKPGDKAKPEGESLRKRTGKPKALKDLAERLELAPEDLYGLEIPMAQGEPLTLGKLKDIAAAQGDFTVRELKSEEERTRKESDLIRAQEELRELVDLLPEAARKPELLEKIRQRHAAKLSVERARTLDAIPAWNDEATREAELTGMVEHLQSYGFPANYLASVLDHRLLKFMRESYLREKRIRAALARVTDEKPAPVPRARAQPNAPTPIGADRRRRGPETARSRLFDVLDLKPE